MVDFLLIDNSAGLYHNDKPRGWYYQRSDNILARWFGPYATAAEAKTAADKATNGGKCINTKWVTGRTRTQHV